MACQDDLRRLLGGLLKGESLKPTRMPSDLSECLRLLESDEFSPISLRMHSGQSLKQLDSHTCDHRLLGPEGLNQSIQKLMFRAMAH